uniref:Alpha-methylacyl-CoA racemase n=1 Tax=Homalodisca liturata TaxID=320908 RepID=A0A1B6IRN8_9HEMI
MALRGIKVLEIAGLAPAPFCGMILADFGATVVRVDKTVPIPDIDCLSNGKRSVAINLKTKRGVEVFQKLCSNTDVLIEPFRKGVMEKLGLGPSVLMRHNPRLVYARLSGFGQEGTYSERVGHDINFVSMSGLLSLLGEEGRQPTPPGNFAADFGGGGLMCALGIVLALLERHTSGTGQVVDCGMVGGTAYLASWLMRSQTLPIWGQQRGCNILDGGAHFYTTYQTKDGGWMAVGAVEPQFYDQLLQGLGLEDVPQFPYDFAECKRIFAEKFKEKTQHEWCQIFEGLDACVTPVLSLSDAATHPHNVANRTFVADREVTTPNPAPKLSHTPGQSLSHLPRPRPGQHTQEVLKEAGLPTEEIQELLRSGVVGCTDSKL